MNWTQSFAQRTSLMQRNTVRELLKLTAQPGMISFAGGLPAPELLPVAEVAQATTSVTLAHGQRALQYGETEGVAELRDWIAAKYSRTHLQLRREHVMIVTGSQQALDLIGKVFLNPGDSALMENPTYLATLLAWRPHGPNFVPVPSDSNGMRVEELEDEAVRSAKLLYLVPNFQNPQGTTLSLRRRKLLAEKSLAAGLPIIEDNPYGELRYSGIPLPHLLELNARTDADGCLHSNVIYLGTFSKVLAPGLRVGWVIAPEEVIEKLVQAKQAADLHTSTLCQHIVLQMLKDGAHERLLPRLLAAYRQRRDTMLAAMQNQFPSGITWTCPEGGMFLLAFLPEHLDATAVLEKALEQKVAFIPGESFHLGDSGKNTFRLNFSNQPADSIDAGITRLSAVLKTMM